MELINHFNQALLIKYQKEQIKQTSTYVRLFSRLDTFLVRTFNFTTKIETIALASFFSRCVRK